MKKEESNCVIPCVNANGSGALRCIDGRSARARGGKTLTGGALAQVAVLVGVPKTT